MSADRPIKANRATRRACKAHLFKTIDGITACVDCGALEPEGESS